MGQYIKRKPVRDLKARRLWRRGRSWCYACGTTVNLQAHHLVRPGRSDEPTNLAMCCNYCHYSCHGIIVIRAGVRQPLLSLGAQLWLKRAHDPGEYDPDRLSVLYGKALPELEEPPEYYRFFLRKRKVLLA